MSHTDVMHSVLELRVIPDAEYRIHYVMMEIRQAPGLEDFKSSLFEGKIVPIKIGQGARELTLASRICNAGPATQTGVFGFRAHLLRLSRLHPRGSVIIEEFGLFSGHFGIDDGQGFVNMPRELMGRLAEYLQTSMPLSFRSNLYHTPQP